MRLRLLLLIAAAVAPAASLSLHTAAFLLPRAAVASPSLRTVSLRPAATRTARARPPSATAEPLAAAAALSAADSASVLVGADMFGKTFLAGISIAAATLVTTIFAIDDLEMSTAVDAEVSDFFGSNLNPESAPPAETACERFSTKERAPPGGGSAGGPAERSDAPSAPAEKLP
ncbi:hypothetical protein EMIHUDRAFT_458003 [Emiliania huxleyi CCMP1516]|uniref:Uncharacterized protein n=2 Tax=Emiliania huxleyi TaxID=2903 RepID=A0A0D3JJ11_EMIH1|nr:hypothetical protein EMIHUDRAFT_458003 [Emiliania huxleyi CCMP1516]EOD23496.1 hypothetical protein EMIHUDRAFT_458003 [Emiliania huxleyi CCMP1516]|eukprot:XP_005775925.1 hypothetical protein EMIHUDRAFT_458003 [Emiliania huxleyi CCMP1516]